MEEGLNKQHLEQVIQNLGNEYLWVAIGVAVTFFCRDLIMNFVQGMLVFLGSNIENDDIIYATRDVITHTNVLTADYIFNNRMGLTFRLRHYWSFVDNSSFHSLDNDGHLAQTDFQGFYDDGTSPYDQSFNAFNIDMVYKWVFAPGSELSIVWKNSILDNDEILPDTWTDNFDRALGLPQVNSFSIRLLYFVDYLTFARKEKMIEN